MKFSAEIYKSGKRVFTCKLAGNGELVEATALREVVKNEHPVVGDRVDLQVNDQGEYEVVAITPRENFIFRRIVRSQQVKVIAANLDLVIIMASVSKPTYKTYLVDRYLLRATQWEVPAIVIFNKMDEFEANFDIEFEQQKLQSIGVESFLISSMSGQEKWENQIQELRDRLQGKLSICLGQSGVGKSKFITALSNEKVELTSSRLAKKVEKGAHTTSWSEIIEFDGVRIIDSPGVRSLSVQDILEEEIDELFFDLFPLFQQCKFTDCKHLPNSNGCFFAKLEGENQKEKIILDRLVSYHRIKADIQSLATWEK